MGNIGVNCFQRWGRRRPDGPLIKAGSIGAQSTRPSTEPSEPRTSVMAAGAGTTAAAAAAGAAGATAGAGAQSGTEGAGARGGRRRPSYAPAKGMRAPSESEAELDAESVDAESEDENQASTQDLYAGRIAQYRKELSTRAKLSAGIVSKTIHLKVDGGASKLEWYPVEGDKKKVMGSILLNNLVKVSAGTLKPHMLEISGDVNGTVTSYTFQFKSSDARESWQKSLEELRNFLKMR
eukprot:GHVU01054464.1.p1 GENE.GHVU01054464.1~~GHVU01054464.1.p1  ORF type:complete len:237 (+),score=51.90 GHVU01054464.1:208-918(+)